MAGSVLALVWCYPEAFRVAMLSTSVRQNSVYGSYTAVRRWLFACLASVTAAVLCQLVGSLEWIMFLSGLCVVLSVVCGVAF